MFKSNFVICNYDRLRLICNEYLTLNFANDCCVSKIIDTLTILMRCKYHRIECWYVKWICFIFCFCFHGEMCSIDTFLWLAPGNVIIIVDLSLQIDVLLAEWNRVHRSLLLSTTSSTTLPPQKRLRQMEAKVNQYWQCSSLSPPYFALGFFV